MQVSLLHDTDRTVMVARHIHSSRASICLPVVHDLLQTGDGYAAAFISFIQENLMTQLINNRESGTFRLYAGICLAELNDQDWNLRTPANATDVSSGTSY